MGDYLATKRYLILSDIHSNEAALQAVMNAVKRRRYTAVLCMGDLVGYGASPNPVVSRLRRLSRFVAVRGNHDKVCVGIESGENFNTAARTAALWTQNRLTEVNKNFLASLPKGPLEVEEGLWICHGSFIDEDYYMFSDFDAYQAFEARPFWVCFFGHTHIPYLFRRRGDVIEMVRLAGDREELQLDPSCKYLINPGSVGQPRDRNPKAAFAEFYPESGRLTIRRVAYDAPTASAKIKRANLPENLANRLLWGT